MRKAIFLLAIALLAVGTYAQDTTQGTLYAVNKKGTDLGACPLKSTAVRADISGYLARVSVKQEFENTFAEPIEAVYTFPLSQNGAVDDMTMTIGTRVVRGRIMKRDEARQVYETAKAAGQAASLLDQERPNIFTQAVANIMPGEKIVIEISYVETLKYEDGSYEFVFPMTVGPRYIPAGVKDASKIRPPVAESRPGHDISVEVNLNAGVPVESIRSTSHAVEQLNIATGKAKITLQGEKTIPNKDFILRYDATGKRLEDGVLAHRDKQGGFVTLVLQPPDTVAPEDRTPKEIVFVLDTSGSMHGFPIEKAKEAMRLSLDNLYPEDTFNLITFAGDTHVLFEKPVPATQANLERAQAFLESRQGGGGTEMMKAIKAALDPSDSQEHLRIVCFMTDGFVGNDDEIIAEIQKHPKARIFSFGIGSSVNRFLLDKMAEAGNGEAEFVSLTDDGSKAAKRFYERVRTPMLTDLSIDWNGLPVADVYPAKIGDLFSAKPVVVNARYTKAAAGTIKLKGKVAGQPYERTINVNLPESEPANNVLATLWARRRVDELSMEALKGGPAAEAANKQIEGLGLEFRIMTSFTSFVAVEEQIVNRNGTPTRVEVPVAIPEGVDRQMAGAQNETVDVSAGSPIISSQVAALPVSQRKRKTQTYGVWGDPRSKMASISNGTGSGGGMGTGVGTGSGSGSGSGSDRGTWIGPAPVVASASTSVSTTDSIRVSSPRVVSGGVLNGKAVSLPKPAYPAAARAVRATGAVSVQVTIDENGAVLSAVPVSGHPLLRAEAAKAAAAAKFVPTMMSGQPVQVTGVITYYFTNPNGTVKVSKNLSNPQVVAPGNEPPPPPLPPAEAVRLQMVKSKLHAWLFAVVERLGKADAKPAPNEALFIRDGKAAVRLELKRMSAQTRAKLESLGFEIESLKGTTALGRIATEKLEALAEIEEITLILPRT